MHQSLATPSGLQPDAGNRTTRSNGVPACGVGRSQSVPVDNRLSAMTSPLRVGLMTSFPVVTAQTVLSFAESKVFFVVFTLFAICQQHIVESAASSFQPPPQFPNRMSIGAIFDKESSLARTAYRYEVERHNNSSSTIKFAQYVKDVNFLGNFELSKAMCAAMANGVVALFGFINSPSSLRSIESLARTFNMPYITPAGPSASAPASAIPALAKNRTALARNAFILYLRPSYRNAIVGMVQYYQWKKVYYIYDTNEGLTHIELMNSQLNRDDVSVEIVGLRLQEVDRCHVALRQLDAREPSVDKYIILDMSSNAVLQSVLKQIQNVGMNRDNYHYLLGTLSADELDVEDFQHGGANITGFRLVNPVFPRTMQIQAEWSKLNPSLWPGAGRRLQLEAALTMDAVMSLVKGMTMLSDSSTGNNLLREWVRRGKVYSNGTLGIHCKHDSQVVWALGQRIMQHLKEVSFNGSTGRVSFDDFGHRKNYELDVIEQRQDNDPVKVATWDSARGLLFNRSDTHGGAMILLPANRTRIITTIVAKPYYMLKVKSEDQKDETRTENAQYEGYCNDLAEMICKELGITCEIRLVADGKYGEKTGDGTWNGMIGELTNRTVDMAIAPLTITAIRERVVDFSKPFMSLGISIMIKKPEKQKPGVFSFMDPLSYKVWVCIMFSYLAVSTVLFLVSRFSSKEWQIEDSPHGPTFTNDFTILNSLWFSLGAFMRRGCDVCPRSLAGRIVGSAWWFFTLIIISSYTANLAAFLTIERMLTPIESADDLAKQSEILYGTLQSGSTQDFFRTSKISVYEKMWSFMSSDKSLFVKTVEDGVTRVRNSKGRYAFLLESTMNDYYNQRKPCNTMKVGENLDSKGYGIATPIGSDLRSRINVIVLQLLEREQLQKLHKKWWYDKGQCIVETENKKGGSSQSSLSLSNVAGIFYILIAGLGLSMIVASIEYVIKSRADTRRQRKRYLEKTQSSSSSSHCYHDFVQERENGGYAYTAPCGMVTVNSCFDVTNTHTQV